MSQEFQSMASQLSKKAALPLAKIFATCRNNFRNTGPWIAPIYLPSRKAQWINFQQMFAIYRAGTSRKVKHWCHSVALETMLLMILDCILHLDLYGLVWERCNSIANALELHFSCTNSLICFIIFIWEVVFRSSVCKMHQQAAFFFTVQW